MRPDVKEFREFLRTVCMVSAMMASITFVGTSILISTYPPSGFIAPVRGLVAHIGLVAVFGFSATSIVALFRIDPVNWLETKKKIKTIRKLMWVLLILNWSFFLVLIAGLLFAFYVA